jgi:prevent-host-death family protein
MRFPNTMLQDDDRHLPIEPNSVRIWSMMLSASEDIAPISQVKANFAELLDRSRENHRPTIVTQNGRATGVLVAIEDWEEQQRKIQLLKLLAEGEESLRTFPGVGLADAKKRLKNGNAPLK